ncbi:hypothetical protein [Mucilaginibacter gotjawali]|uniref:Flagellar biosynthesis component FlhA n=1 Tax=Mucilaginibacter gotjawali TaxID=1550579 RepID=A0A839SK03_9SPHI|nr:hypothetical protein [Mucilaginibacter gotjawali]MBB3056817.1 flagellar biosynthesis component FlhA [Mucilaginibacter gotjawali]
MEIYYLIDGKKYLDGYLLREHLQLNRSEIQKLLDAYPLPKDEIVNVQNKKLFPLSTIKSLIESLLKEHE